MLTDKAKAVASRLRGHVGNERAGVGPDISELTRLFDDLDPGELRNALEELEQLGFINLNEGMCASSVGQVPKELKGIAGLQVLEPLQAYFDDIGS